jgi:hypothetical protein
MRAILFASATAAIFDDRRSSNFTSAAALRRVAGRSE